MPATARQKAQMVKYNKDHKEQHRFYSYRSYARKFIRDMSRPEDLDHLESMIQARREELNK